MNEPSVFTKIINRELESEIVFETERIIVIKNIDPQAPVHLLGITKKPYQSIDALLQGKNEQELLWELFTCLSNLAHEFGIAEAGYRLVTNIGKDGGQSVPHLHVHLLGGAPLDEKRLTL